VAVFKGFAGNRKVGEFLFKRLSLGLEYQRANFSANINKYHAFSDKKLINGLQKQERANQ
jgi:hypothetical protein